MALTDYSCQDLAHASDAVCPACLGTGQVTDRITVQDALADAETLLSVGPLAYSDWWAISQVRKFRGIPDGERYGYYAALAAFRAVPGLRG